MAMRNNSWIVIGVIAVTVAGYLMYQYKVPAQNFLGALMPSSTWGLVGSLALLGPPVRDLILRRLRDSAAAQQDPQLQFINDAIAQGWEVRRNAATRIDTLALAVGGICLAISFYLDL